MKVKLGALDNARKAQLTRQADRIATELEAQRELDSVCLVIDMDMFYAAVEIRSAIGPTFKLLNSFRLVTMVSLSFSFSFSWYPRV